MGLVADGDVIPDLAPVADALEEAFVELRDAAGVKVVAPMAPLRGAEEYPVASHAASVR